MALKIIGAGFGRTGTSSLKVALEILGFTKCYHMVEMLAYPEHTAFWEAASRGEAVNWDALFEDYQATVDFPWAICYKELFAHYPDAKVILTVRDPARWYESAQATIRKASPRGWRQWLLLYLMAPFSPRIRRFIPMIRTIRRLLWKEFFEGRFDDRDYAITRFLEHKAAVQELIPPEQLLVYEVKQGWEPLCNFLGVPVPQDQPFPHANTRSTFKQRSQRLMQRPRKTSEEFVAKN